MNTKTSIWLYRIIFFFSLLKNGKNVRGRQRKRFNLYIICKDRLRIINVLYISFYYRHWIKYSQFFQSNLIYFAIFCAGCASSTIVWGNEQPYKYLCHTLECSIFMCKKCAVCLPGTSVADIWMSLNQNKYNPDFYYLSHARETNFSHFARDFQSF